MRNLSVFVLTLALLAGIAAARPAQAAETWTVDPAHSSIVWAVGHMNGVGKVYGRFNSFSGTVVTDAEDLSNSSVEITIDAASIDSAVGARDEHLRNPDFFDVENHPSITFKSSSIAATDDADVYAVTGDMTILGESREVTIDVRMTGTTQGRGGEPVAGFASEFTIKRSDWGLSYGVPGLSDEIEVMLAFEVKGEAPAAE